MKRRVRSNGTAIFRRPQWSHHAAHRPLAFSPRRTGATIPRRARREVAQRSSVCARRMSRRVDSFRSGFPTRKRATTLHAGLMLDSLATQMRPECRPPPAIYSGGRTPFAWDSPTSPSSGGRETPAPTALRADSFRCCETESPRLGAQTIQNQRGLHPPSTASMSFRTVRGMRSLPHPVTMRCSQPRFQTVRP